MARVTSPAGPHSHVSYGARAILREMLTGPRGRDLHALLRFRTDSESTMHVADEVGTWPKHRVRRYIVDQI